MKSQSEPVVHEEDQMKEEYSEFGIDEIQEEPGETIAEEGTLT